ncbi:MAG: hypothetical protein ACRC6V_01650 [Bacteroidales bacterium]
MANTLPSINLTGTDWTNLNTASGIAVGTSIEIQNQASQAITLESPGSSFNPVVSSTVIFNKAAGQEHFISVTQPIFISADVVTNGLEIYLNPIGTNISVYDYSVFIQKTYIPMPV